MLRIFAVIQLLHFTKIFFSGMKYSPGTHWILCCVLIVLISFMQEMGSGNTSQKSDEEDFVKVDDLPLQLTVMCEVCTILNTCKMFVFTIN